jgi:type II secretory ATPase GspE/PulE/Tfp pilus assembly ATPase PilB-like protein/GAF domain-containing protein
MPLTKPDGKSREESKPSSQTANKTMEKSAEYDEKVDSGNAEGSSEESKLQTEKRTLRQVTGRRASDLFHPILKKIFSAVASANITESFHKISSEIKIFLGCEALVISSVDRTKNQIYSRNLISKNDVEVRLPISSNSLAGYVAKIGREIIVTDVNADSEISRYPGLKCDPAIDKKISTKTKAAMVFPIFQGKSLIGVLEIINSTKGESFSEQIKGAAREFSKALGQVLEKLENEEDSEVLKSIGLATQRAAVTEESLFELSDPILDLLNAEKMALFLVEDSKKEIYTKILVGNKMVSLKLPISPGSIAGWVAEDKQLVNIADVYNVDELSRIHKELRHNDSMDISSGSKTRGVLCCPLLHDGELMGVLQVLNKSHSHNFNVSDEKNIKALSQYLAIAIHNNREFVKSKPHKYSYLIDNDILSANELEKAGSRSRSVKVLVDQILIDEFKVKKDDIGKSLEAFYGIPFHSFDESVILPKQFFVGLNIKFLMKNYWVPIQNDDNLVVVLIDDPMDNEKIRSIKMTFPKKEIQFRVGLRMDIINFLNAGATGDFAPPDPAFVDEDVSSLLESIKSSREYEENISEAKDEEEESSISESDNSIVRLVNKIIIDAHLKGVSDIHIEPGVGKKPLIVRYRTEGECEEVEKIPHIYKFAMVSRIKIMAKLDISERRLPQDGKIKVKYGNKNLEYRVATCPTVGGNEDVVLRVLAGAKPIPLDEMHLSPRNEKIIRKSMHSPHGLVLCVGPTGSGKTTTLHSCLGFINTPKKKIWTAEDPVEITQEGLRQVQVHPKIGFDFPRAMKTFLRGDPDVIMVGEMRDVETASIGLEASLTGHLVLSTLHTNSAPETITRLIDIGMSPLNFADALVMIIAQRLVKSLCPKCKEDYNPTQEEFDTLRCEYGEIYFPRLGIEHSKNLTICRPVGCDACKNSGYLGRIALHELLEGNEKIRRLILKQAMVEEIRETAIQSGMTTLKQDGIYKIFNGDCDLKQVLTVC